MMREVVAEVAAATGEAMDVAITIGIPGGEALAQKTLNPRLGIVGGLSILGTTGVVVPYSCAAWIHSIHRGIDVARAAGLEHVAAATGSTSERTVQELYALPEMALLDMGDFAGGTFKYLRRHPVPRVTLAGGFAKLAKLAQGHLDLHSSRSVLDQPVARPVGGEAWRAGATGRRAWSGRTRPTRCWRWPRRRAFRWPTWSPPGRGRWHARWPGRSIALEVLVVDRQGRVVGRAPGW